MPEKPRIFISYSRKDEDFAREVHGAARIPGRVRGKISHTPARKSRKKLEQTT